MAGNHKHCKKRLRSKREYEFVTLPTSRILDIYCTSAKHLLQSCNKLQTCQTQPRTGNQVNIEAIGAREQLQLLRSIAVGDMADGKLKCAVVGAGPVGALAALYAARRGYEVDVYELRGGE